MANPILWTNVTDEAAELATGVSAGAQFALLDYANTKIDVTGLDGEDGRKTFLARVFWVAHIATLLKRRGVAGARTAQSAGGVSESFTLPQMTNLGPFSQTSYGILYATIVGASAHRAGKLLNRRVVVTGDVMGGFWGGRGDGGGWDG